MIQVLASSCCVCGYRDERALVEVVLDSGEHATLCGSHAIMHARSESPPRTFLELRAMLADRRERSDRRSEGDELGAALTAAFSGGRRERDRRRLPQSTAPTPIDGARRNRRRAL